MDLPGGLPPGAVRLYLVRHGEAEGAREGRLVGKTDVPLTARGKRQMAAAARRLRPWFQEWPASAVYSSPLVRARESAEVIKAAISRNPWSERRIGAERGREAGSTALPLKIISALREISLGEWEGETYEELMAREPERMRRYYARFDRSRPPGGESLLDLRARALPALVRILRKHAGGGSDKGGGAILVAHAAVNRVILAEALGLPLRNLFALAQDAGALNVVDFYGLRAGAGGRKGGAVVRLLNG